MASFSLINFSSGVSTFKSIISSGFPISSSISLAVFKLDSKLAYISSFFILRSSFDNSVLIFGENIYPYLVFISTNSYATVWLSLSILVYSFQ